MLKPIWLLINTILVLLIIVLIIAGCRVKNLEIISNDSGEGQNQETSIEADEESIEDIIEDINSRDI